MNTQKIKDCLYIETSSGGLSVPKLFWPMLTENILKYFITTVNTLILSMYSDDAVAAVGVAGQIINLYVVLQSAIGAGVNVVISQNLGADNRKKANHVSTVAIGLMLVIAMMFMSVMVLFSRQFLTIMQLEERLMGDGRKYLIIVAIFSVFESLITVFSAIARCYGYTKIPMFVIIVMNALNALGSYIVIIRPFEVPWKGVEGVAYARGASAVISFILILIIIRKVPVRLTLDAFRKENKPFENIRTILKIGVPSGLSGFSYTLSQAVATAILAKIGASAVTTMVYINSIVQYVQAFSTSLGQAYQIVIGWLVGMNKKEKARKIGTMSFLFCAVGNTILAIIVLFARYQLLGIFTESREIIQLAANVMFIDIVVELFRGMNHAGGGCLAAAGDVKYYMIIGIGSCWCFSILFSYLFGVALHLGIYGCWLAFCMDEAFRASSYLRRWLSGKWKKYSLVEPTADEN